MTTTQYEVWLRDSTSVALQAFGLEASLEVRSRTASGRPVVRATIGVAGTGTVSPRRWSQVAQALQSLAEVGAVARGLTHVDFEVVLSDALLPEPVTAGPEEGLARAARKLARRASSLGRSVAIGPMGSASRRVLHEALGEVREVHSQSDGEGLLRRLWVMPRQGRGPEAGGR